MRFDQAHWHREEDAFVAVAEAVSWAVALDAVLEDSESPGRDKQTYKRGRGASDDGKTVIGMKFVRNFVHHSADMLNFVYVNAVIGNSQYGMRSYWKWTDFADLTPVPDPQYPSGLGLYKTHLGGRGVLDTLLDANRYFVSLSPAIPPLPPSPIGEQRDPFRLPDRWPPVENDRRG